VGTGLVTRSLAARAAAEAVGTFLLVGLGTGSIVVAAREGGIPSWAMALAWFFAVLLPILLVIETTGAHLNPAVTLALAGSGRISWREVPAYVTGQVAGAVGASALLLGIFGDVAHLGATVPTGGIVRAFVGELSFTAALVTAVFLLSDRGEGRRRWRLLLPPAVVGVSTYVIGPWSGSSLNPARTLAPAVVSGTFTDLWLYLFAVPAGAVLVAILWKPRSVDRLDRGAGRVSV
jgi:glycerol uptake facilitator-like aquaporin